MCEAHQLPICSFSIPKPNVMVSKTIIASKKANASFLETPWHPDQTKGVASTPGCRKNCRAPAASQILGDPKIIEAARAMATQTTSDVDTVLIVHHSSEELSRGPGRRLRLLDPCFAIRAAPHIISWGGLVTDAFISTEDQQLAAPAAQHCMTVSGSKSNFHQALPFSAFPVSRPYVSKVLLAVAASDDKNAAIGGSQNRTKMGTLIPATVVTELLPR
mmetsp:Transcript_53257/g.84942  ORF Transcript_53257/g.84942 Transcript_53257/m.84942 type:complete len:218 (-) Transcript_53257:102-755(-)